MYHDLRAWTTGDGHSIWIRIRMEGFVRKIRDTKPGDACSLYLFLDEVETPGSIAVFRSLLTLLTSSVTEGRASLGQVRVVALENDPARLGPLPNAQLVNLYRDPFQLQGCASAVDGITEDTVINTLWTQLQPDAHPGHPGRATSTTARAQGSTAVPAAGAVAAESPLVTAAAAAPNISVPAATPSQDAAYRVAGGGVCLVLDSLSCLMLYSSPMQGVAALHQLLACGEYSCILARVHEDMTSPPHMAQLHALCTSWLTAAPCTDAERSWSKAAGKLSPHGRVTARHKRAVGRVRVEAELYAIMTDGSVQYYEVPPQTSAQQLVNKELGTLLQESRALKLGDQAGASAAANANTMPTVTYAGGMKLQLTDKEKAARSEVVLPHEQRIKEALVGSGDWRDRLPRAAGGRGAAETHGQTGTAALGEIHYVRDTDSEYDSDEDPDDDLDL